MIQHLQLRDRGDNILRYIDINTLATFKRTEYINGKHVLSMEFAPDAEYISELVKYNKILFKDSELDKWFEFVIASVTSTVKSLKVELESSFYSTLSCFIPFVDITGNTVINGMYKLFNYAYPASDWSVGTSDITGSYYMQRTRSTEEFANYVRNNSLYLNSNRSFTGDDSFLVLSTCAYNYEDARALLICVREPEM